MTFFTDLSIVIVVVSIVALVFSRFNLPLTVGYILAGVIVGPTIGPALINNQENIKMLSDLGVMFLMFSIGLGFSFRQLRSRGMTVTLPAFWDVGLMIVGGFFMGKVLGWGNLECFLLGLVICNSSTSIAAKTLEELGLVKERFASNAFAIAVVEDILSILLIAVLYGVGANTGEGNGDWWATAMVIGRQMGVMVLFLVGVTIFGIGLAPRLLNFVSRSFGDEIVLMTALGICFGISYLAQNVLGLSLVVGAFLAGTILSYVHSRARLERIVKPVSQLFAAVFFVSVGLMVEPLVIWENIGTVLFVSVGMIVLKLANGFLASTLLGESPTDAFRTGLALGQVAEFAFIIATLGMELHMTERPLFQIAVGVALICTATCPYLLRYSPQICGALRWTMPQRLRHALFAYRRLITQMQSRDAGQPKNAWLRTNLLLLMVNSIAVVILFTIVYVASTLPVVKAILEPVEYFWQPFSVHIPWGGLLCLMCAFLVSLVPFWAIQHILRDLATNIANAIPMLFFSQRDYQFIRRFIRLILTWINAVALGIFAVMISMPFVVNVWMVAPVLIVALAFQMRYSKRMRQTYQQHHKVIARAFDVNVPDAVPTDSTLRYLLSVHTEEWVVPHDAICCQKTLAELNVRQRTGASLISVQSRTSTLKFSPGGETRLKPGDHVLICGNEMQIAEAIEFLSAVE